jgi:hypothetical protein
MKGETPHGQSPAGESDFQVYYETLATPPILPWTGKTIHRRGKRMPVTESVAGTNSQLNIKQLKEKYFEKNI